MNPISNIWNHPKTSAAGVLIAVVTIASVLSQQGITLGNVGSGSVSRSSAAWLPRLLGLLARDPVSSGPTSGNPTAKLGAWALIALLLQLPFVSGCSGTSVAQDIVNWTPALQSAVATVDSTAALLAPADAPIFVAATAGFDAASNLLVAQAKAYLANPSASVLAQLQAAVVAFQQQVNASLLQAAKITNPNSQQHVLNAINAVATVVMRDSGAGLLHLQQSCRGADGCAIAPSSWPRCGPIWMKTRLPRWWPATMASRSSWARVQVAQVELSAAQAGF